MSNRDPLPLPGPWLRAVAYATQAPDVEDSLLGILGEAVPATGARGAALVESDGTACLATAGWEAAEVHPLLAEGGALRAALAVRERWGADTHLLPRGAGDDDLLVVPLRLRGLGVGTLLLRYPADEPPGADAHQTAAAYAGLMALVLENEHHFEDARIALQSREHFLVALNHELRTPANAIMLNADLLRSGAFGDLPPKLDATLRETEARMHEMVAVLRRVLDLGGLERQASSDREDIVKPRDLIAGLLRRVEPAAKRKQLSLALFVPRNLPTLQTDSARFSRVLLYLFSNAIKYTSRGGVQVRVERGTRPAGIARNEPVLIVRVRDTGSGIPPEELARIFEPFAQVEEGARTDSRARGLGLGLPLARQLARSLGGDVTVESTPQQGTEAVFVLPYVREG